MTYEAKLLIEFGYEVFTPKIIPIGSNFRSGAVTAEYDQSLTIPASSREELNKFNFYETVWPPRIVTLINRYFGTAYIMPHGVQVTEAVRKFEGQLMFRAFGLDGARSYIDVLEAMYGSKVFADVAAVGSRFRFAQAYEQLVECEPPLLAENSVFLPIGVPSHFWDTANYYTGTVKQILFVCPFCVTNSYYSSVYKKFKQDFGDFPHVIVGAQDVDVDDPHVLGFVTDSELARLYRESAVFYYHSTEPRHVHYSPIEASINGMPVVYFEYSLLGRITPEITMGRCRTIDEARSSIKRVLDGDDEYIAALKKQQESLTFKFSDEYCKAVWKNNLEKSGYEAVTGPESVFKVYWREFKRFILNPVAHGLSRLPLKEPTMPEVAQINPPDANDVSSGTIRDGIDFSLRHYPSYLLRVAGLNMAEWWGRWSDASKVTISFIRPLPTSFRLSFRGCAYGPNKAAPVIVTVGNVKKTFKLHGNIESPDTISVDFKTRKKESSIEFHVPRPTVPPNGTRRIGIGFINLKIEPNSSEK